MWIDLQRAKYVDSVRKEQSIYIESLRAAVKSRILEKEGLNKLLINKDEQIARAYQIQVADNEQISLANKQIVILRRRNGLLKIGLGGALAGMTYFALKH